MKKSLLLLVSLLVAAVPAFASPSRRAVRPADVRPASKVATRSNLSHQVIFEAPEGETVTYSAAYSGWALSFVSFSYEPTYNSGFASEAVFCDNGDVYLKNFFGIVEMNMYSYIKGKRVGDRIIVPNLTCVGGYNDEDDYEPTEEYPFGPDGSYMYLAVMTKDTESDEINFIVDSSVEDFAILINGDGSLTLDLPEGCYLGECYETMEWLGYAMDKETLTPFAAEAMYELPDGLEAEKWVLSGTADARFVNVAISGSDIYLGNVYDDTPGYIKGSVDGTKVTFPSGQYIGLNPLYNFYTYLTGGVWGTYSDPLTCESYEDYVRTDDITFLYDPEARTLTGNENEGLFVNLGTADYIYYIAMYAPASLKYRDPAVKPARPRNPVITDCYYDENYEMTILDFELPKTDVNGDLLDVDNMYYNFFCNEELFTFYSDQYYTLEFDGIEEMTDVPYTFSDAFDWLFIGGTSVYHSLSILFNGADSVGLKLCYRCDDGTVLESDYVGIDMASVKDLQDAEAASTSYFDLAGRRVASPSAGVYVKVDILSDGSRRASKLLVK